MKRRLCILGSTGTIGVNSLALVDAHPNRFEVVSLTGGKNIALLREQIRKFSPKRVAVLSDSDAKTLQSEFPDLKVDCGQSGIFQCIEESVDVVVNGIVGFAGLAPAIHAIRHKRLLGLANKECLVAAGPLMRAEMEKSGAQVVPVDSEHNALFQLLAGVKGEDVESLALTASGGPFFRKPEIALETITPEQAIAHPNWKMGPKISVDSATMMNKGLEIIEAHYLYGFSEDKIEVWVHPQSIVHGAVRLKDGTLLAQLSVPDMKSAIGYSMTYPERLENSIRRMGFRDFANLEFCEPDIRRFKCLELARNALRLGPSHTLALNAFNEVAVEAFLNKRIGFHQIPLVIEKGLEKFLGMPVDTLEAIYSCDEAARAQIQTLL